MTVPRQLSLLKGVRRQGDRPPTASEFRARFEEKFIPEPNSGCWIWIRALANGYGRLRFDRKYYGAHRAAWLLYRGEIPNGLRVLHKCDVPACVNPDHLFLGRQKENMADCVTKGRTARNDTHGRAYLSIEQVKAIRAASGSQEKIAAEYGISRGQVGRIRQRVSWRYLP